MQYQQDEHRVHLMVHHLERTVMSAMMCALEAVCQRLDHGLGMCDLSKEAS
jgi:hypothetical protein